MFNRLLRQNWSFVDHYGIFSQNLLAKTAKKDFFVGSWFIVFERRNKWNGENQSTNHWKICDDKMRSTARLWCPRNLVRCADLRQPNRCICDLHGIRIASSLIKHQSIRKRVFWLPDAENSRDAGKTLLQLLRSSTRRLLLHHGTNIHKDSQQKRYLHLSPGSAVHEQWMQRRASQKTLITASFLSWSNAWQRWRNLGGTGRCQVSE